MRIGILVLAAGRSAGGPETYEVELVRALAELDASNEYLIYCAGAAAADAFGRLPANFTRRILRPAFRPAALAFTLPRWLAADRVDLLHATYAPPPALRVPLIFTMHCFSNFAHPEYYPAFVRWRLNSLQRFALRRAERILCVSDFVAERLQQDFGIPTERLATIYNGVSAAFAPIAPELARRRVAERFGLDDPYILYAGKLQARKNVIGLIQAYASYLQQAERPVKLVLAGKKVETSEGIDETIERTRLAGKVVQLGYLPPPSLDAGSVLPHLYAAAAMTVLPSFYEGFGLPLVEAMACGSPVIAANASSLPEIAGGAALLVDPHSIGEIAAAMAEVDRNRGKRTQMIESGLRRASQFTWANCARQTLAAYEALGRKEVKPPMSPS
jgi:glycosyltransferase involved in cell wall biosynthesis